MTPGGPTAAGRVRPARWVGPVGSTAGLLLIWGAVAHASGSGWVQALGALATGMAVVGMLGPSLAVRRVRLEVDHLPEDATTNEPCRIRVTASAACRLLPVRPGGPPASLPAGSVSEVLLLPEHRGLLRSIEVDVSSASPFGLLWWRQRRRLVLPRLLVVSPKRAPSGRAGEESDEPGIASSLSRLAETGERRGSREYRVGDSWRRVDWRSTAHTGLLMVRESDASVEPVIRLAVDLPEEPGPAEEAASRLLAAIAGHLDKGHPVLLDPVGREMTPVRLTSVRQAGRVLARLGPNPWGDLGEEVR